MLGIAALIAFAGAAGIIWRDAADDEKDEEEETAEADDEGGWISLGWLIHEVLSIRARIARLFRRRLRQRHRGSVSARGASRPDQSADPRLHGRL